MAWTECKDCGADVDIMRTAEHVCNLTLTFQLEPIPDITPAMWTERA